MTKTERLEAKVAELEAKLEEAGVKTKPTKMDEICELETSAIDSIRSIVCECEKATGRTLSHKAIPDCVDEIMEIDPTESLKEHMRTLGKHLKQSYSFKTVSDFSRWARPFIREGFRCKKKY